MSEIDYSALKFQYSTRDESKARSLAKILNGMGFVTVLLTHERVYRDLDGNIIGTERSLSSYGSLTEIMTDTTKADLDKARKILKDAMNKAQDSIVMLALADLEQPKQMTLREAVETQDI